MIVKDIAEYCLGCLKCAKFVFATISKTLSHVAISAPMDCLGIDLICPFYPSKTNGIDHTHIPLVIDCFSRYVLAFSCRGDTSAEVVRCLPSAFQKFGVPVGFYADPGSHFGKATKEYVKGAGAIWITSVVVTKKATRMIEKAVQII